LTNVSPWCCYWQDRQYSAWLTGKDPWPTSNTAAQQELANTLPAPCLPMLTSPPYPAPVGTPAVAPAPTTALQAALQSIAVH